jgi:phosphoribosylformylglycinamidine cyclo-ligase
MRVSRQPTKRPEAPRRSYAGAGVNLDAAAALKERIKRLAAPTLGRQVVSGPGFFGGVYDPDPQGETLIVASTDSVGTKVRIALAMGKYDTVGHDIVNHCVNDILPAGATPMFFLDYLAFSDFSAERIEGIVSGLAAACAAAGCALLGGETATLPGIYHGDDFDLVGFIVGSVRKDALLKPDSSREGDVLVGLPSSGLHTNGYSLVRAVFDVENNPRALDERVPGLDRSLGDALLEPHRSYLSALRPVLGKIRGMAHITGGGFHKNLPRSLAGDLGAEIDLRSWEVPPLFRFIQERGQVDEAEMYRVFNMGVGMVVIAAPDRADEVMATMPGAWRLGRVVGARGEERVTFMR